MGGHPKKKQQLYYIEGFTMLSPPNPFSRNKNILRCPWVFSPRPVISPVKRSSYKPTYYPETPGVWYICLHLPKPNVGKYTSPIGLYGPWMKEVHVFLDWNMVDFNWYHWVFGLPSSINTLPSQFLGLNSTQGLHSYQQRHHLCIGHWGFFFWGGTSLGPSGRVFCQRFKPQFFSKNGTEY